MISLYSVAQLRAIERAAASQLAPGTLMRRAGEAAANAALALLAGGPGPVLVLAGPGNNGGDALDAAANLANAGIEVAVLQLAGSGARSPEAAHALARAEASDARFIDALLDAPDWTLAIDGLFGIGLARALDGPARALAEALNGAARPVLALDIPSGLDADSGAVVGPDGIAVQASHTITFIGDKPGLHTCAGRDYAGTVLVAPLDIPPALLPAPEAQLGELALFAHCLRPRRHDSHKGSFGDVAIVGGARGMAGAPLLAARGALFAGAGRVFVAAIDPALQVDSVQPEIMFRDAASYDSSRATLVLGPGMGDSENALALLGRALDGAAPLVIDADALNLIAGSGDLQRRLAARAAPTLLTPHPLEAARLLGVSAAAIQAGRLAAARALATRFGAVAALKGSGTVIARPSGALVINPTGNPGLATGGSGDVLSGVCASLMAQGWPAWEAALGAVWLHGAAADRLVSEGVGPIGLTAGELPAAVRAALNAAVASAQHSRHF